MLAIDGTSHALRSGCFSSRLERTPVHGGFFARVKKKKILNYLKGLDDTLCPVFQYCFFCFVLFFDAYRSTSFRDSEVVEGIKRKARSLHLK